MPRFTLRLPLLGLLLAAIAISACSSMSNNSQACALPAGPGLENAIARVKDDLASHCAVRFDDYFQQLLKIAEGDPKPENREIFSEFLVWCQQSDILSKRQAQALYNRYFNLKFVSLRGDYNNCAATCPNKTRVLRNMEQELVDKEQGLLKISVDRVGYQRADRLFQETELVLEATCSACNTN
mgnify:CR=1 FL=1